jgi:hypothetical protein
MREIHAKGVIFTRFGLSITSVLPCFQPKIALALAMLKILLNDVDSVDGEQ